MLITPIQPQDGNAKPAVTYLGNQQDFLDSKSPRVLEIKIIHSRFKLENVGTLTFWLQKLISTAVHQMEHVNSLDDSLQSWNEPSRNLNKCCNRNESAFVRRPSRLVSTPVTWKNTSFLRFSTAVIETREFAFVDVHLKTNAAELERPNRKITTS